MKILFLAPALPWPPHSGGTRRISAIIERLAARHEVALFALEGDGGAVEETVSTPLSAIRTRPYPGLAERGRVGFWWQVLTDPLPKSVRQAVSDEALADAAAFARSFGPDAIVAEPIEMAPYLRACSDTVPTARTLLGWIDVVNANVHLQTRRDTGFARRLHARREVKRMARLERRAAGWADERTCVSERDRAALERLTRRAFTLVPNGVDASHFAPRNGPVNDRNVLFVGPLSFPPNRDGLKWFAEEILPLVPAVSLTVAGEPAGVAAPPGVGLAGRVSDVRPMMARAGAIVVPLRAGSGTRLKILEALSMGKAVVSTTIGAAGLDVRHGEHLMIADTPADFADAVRCVLSDAALRERLGTSGRALVEAHYRWDDIVEAIEDALVQPTASEVTA